MNTFSISQLEQFSGIKVYTIRIWEQRYNALEPHRSEGNTRYYDNNHLRRLLNIVSLMGGEHKISQICSMNDAELFQHVGELLKKEVAKDKSKEYFISQLISAGIGYDEAYFTKVFTNAVQRFGMRDTYVLIIQPLLLRVGLMWSNNSIPPEQEHFISNLLVQKFYAAIDKLPSHNNSNDSWLLFLPENEFHELSLLFSYYLIRSSGRKVVYLGSNVPFETLSSAIQETNPSNLHFFLVHNDVPQHCQKYLDTLSAKTKSMNIYISGNEKLLSQLKVSKKIRKLATVEDLEKLIPKRL